jgi:FHS family L-fucose permease-like MFS transporter
MGLPAAKLLERTGYKLAVVLGLLGMAASAAAFVPAAILESYDMFLVALFLLVSSITLLQVAANPYVAVIGSPQTASSRLNLVQAFNSLGTALAPLFGAYLIFGRSASGTAQGAVTLSTHQRAADIHTVELPYVLIAVVLLVLALLVWRVRLPDLGKETRRAARAERVTHSLWRHRNLVLGVPAIVLYMICEIGIGSTLVNFISRPDIGAMSHEQAGRYTVLYWGGAMAGRFVGAWLLRWISPGRLLAAVSIGALALAGIAITSSGHLAMWSLIAVGLCHSIMFPTIFTLGIRGLGSADGGRLGVPHRGHRGRRAGRAAGQARRPHRPAALLRAALGVLSLHSVLRGLGLPPDGRRARRAARRLTAPSPVVSSSARCTSSAIAARAVAASPAATASYTRS